MGTSFPTGGSGVYWAKRIRRFVAIVSAASLGVVLAVPVGGASAAQVGTTGTWSLPTASGPTSAMIILLNDQEVGMRARSSERAQALQSEEAPFVSAVQGAGGRVDATGTQLPFLVASVTAAQSASLATNSDVQGVFPDVNIPNPFPEAQAESSTGPASTGNHPSGPPPSICGTAAAPELDPEAVSVINSPQANALGYDGAGVTVGYIAGEIDPTIADFQRNPAYASAASPAGSPVVTPVNFSGDPAGAPGGDVAGESFLDASSIAAQGNEVYNLDNYVSSAHPLPVPCDIKIVGAAPGSSVVGFDVFSSDYDTTESNFIQAIDYAVANGVKVLNESFGANNFPDTALDITRIADDDAAAAGVTVVVSSGDAGVTNTIGSPASDPNLISVGATTTFRAYQQDTDGGINATTPNATNGTWLDNNISSLSSGGFTQSGGNTVDLVAPGDLNWALCSTSPQFADCTNENGAPSPIELSGGTSESAPLTAGAAADVIQAYASTHGGTDPTPALVKQILMSTATDIDAPADQQGAGLLNVLAAVKEAASIPGTTSSPQGGLLISPNQVNIVQAPFASTSQRVSVTNTGGTTVTVDLSTRALTHQVATSSGSLCLNPSSAAISCGPPTPNSFQIWSGVTEVYQEETFTVPPTGGPSRLDFRADYPSDNPPQSSVLHIALYDPTGAYAGYSLPQGLADYADIQVANPVAGIWTAVFFTEQDGATGAGSLGTSGTVQWQAITSEFAPAGSIWPSQLRLAPGATGTAVFTATSPANSGDTAQSIVLQTEGGAATTVPVTVRTIVPLGPNGGTFTGVLTGGNGRGNPAEMNTYVFDVPYRLRDLDVSASFADSNDGVIAFLLDPEGEAVASSSSITLNSAGTALLPTGAVNVYKDNPRPGQWTLVLDWLPPVSGMELSEPFSGAVRFNQVDVSSNMPSGPFALLRAGKSYTFDVSVTNTGMSPQAFFLDPRTNDTTSVRLLDQNGSDQDMSLPLAPGLTFPLYMVPTDTSGINATLTGSVPVTFDVEPFTGDPDLSPAVPAPGVTESQGNDAASLTFTTRGEVMPGYWYLNPSEIGPYGSGGAPPATASATFSAITQAFDLSVTPSTGDLWTVYNGLTSNFAPVYLEPGQSAEIPFTITPEGAPGRVVSGSINVDDAFQANLLVGATYSGGDELASIPYSYRVIGPAH